MPTVTQNAGTLISSAGFTTPSNALGAPNGDYAVCPLTYGGTGELRLSGYGLSGVLPAGCAISKVEVLITGYTSTGKGALFVQGIDVAALANGVDIGSPSHNYFFLFAGSSTTVELEHPTGWTRGAVVNLGVVIYCQPALENTTFRIDAVQIRITYGEAGSGSIIFGGTGVFGGSGTFHHIAYPQRAGFPEYNVEIRGGGFPNTFPLAGFLDDFDTLRYVRRWQEPGEFDLTVSNENGMIAALRQRGNYIRVLRDGAEDFSGKFGIRKANFGPDGKPAWKWSFSGADLSAIARRRILLGSAEGGSPEPSGNWGSSADVPTGTQAPGLLMKQFLTSNYINPSDTGRGVYFGSVAFSDMAIGYITPLGTPITYTQSNQNLVDALSEVARAGGIGFGFTMDLSFGQARFFAHGGVDRRSGHGTSGDVLLSLSQENIVALEYEDDFLSLVNALYVAGWGDGASRHVTLVSDPESVGLAGRQEAYYSTPMSGATSSWITSAGATRLAQRNETERISVTLTPGEFGGYGYFWDLGDTITVHVPEIDVLVDLQVVEVETVLAKGALPQISITLGFPEMDALRTFQEMRRDLFYATQNSPDPYAYTHVASGAGRANGADLDLTSLGVGVRDGATEVVRDTSTSTATWAVRDQGSWVGVPLGSAQAPRTSVFEGPGKTTIADTDFAATPPNGTIAIARDTTGGIFTIGTRINGTWRHATLT